MFEFTYILGDHGWANVVFGNGDATFNISVSYLSDALSDLAAPQEDYFGACQRQRLVSYRNPVNTGSLSRSMATTNCKSTYFSWTSHLHSRTNMGGW